MALKLNIQPELDREMEGLIPKAGVRSKTDYINRAIREYNGKLKRQLELESLKGYFKGYQREAGKVLGEFARMSKFHEH